jgi:tetratricopeptide (TPR) repeat protein
MSSAAEDGLLAWPAQPIAYGFGFEPLQQYLVERERGRLQVLPLAWDARPAAAGGQRWFHPSSETAPRWDGPAYNWNHACAECHSTGVRKGYDAQRDAFATTFVELDVSCEACHGPGSEHVRWAEGDRSAASRHRGFVFELRGAELDAWRPVPHEPTAERHSAAAAATELDVCARCHSRRSQIHQDHPRGASLLDTHVPALLEPPLYFDDGQIREEVYEYGSFLQSKMHGAGVTCSDCHDPHSLQLRAPGNALCGRCHTPQHFDTPAHHHHAPRSRGAACVECHMPARTYMQVDPRRDHSLRVPRPDLSVSLGVPNACEACHPELGASELARRLSSWGVTPDRHYGEVLARARAGDPAVAEELVELVQAPDTPLMVRASAASLLGSVASVGFDVLALALRHEHPLVRLGAVQALDGAAASIRWSLAGALLADPVRAVRFATMRLLADAWADRMGSQRARFDRVVSEWLAAFELNADRAEAHVERGNLLVDLGELDAAELAYARAVTLDPGFSPAYVNWCDLLRRRADEAGCAAKLREGLGRAPDSSELHYAIALSLIRQGQPDAAIPALQTAVQLAPELATYAYALVLALRERGDDSDATAALAAARARHPHDQALRSLEHR